MIEVGADLKALIQGKKKNILITTHQKPDGDALGSSLSMLSYLEKRGHDVWFISNDDFADYYDWMPGIRGIRSLVYHKSKEVLIGQIFEKADIIFCLDYNEISRADKLAPFITEAKAVKVMIDHHIQPSNFATHQFSDTKASSTAEMVFDFICGLGDRDKIDLEMADNLYCGILTDTGSFQFSSTSSNVHRIVADLLDIGVEPARIQGLIYNCFSVKRLQFYGMCLKDKLSLLNEGKVGYIAVSMAEQKEYGLKSGDTEGLVNYIQKIKGLELAAFFREDKEMIKISFRSIGDVDVNQFAREHFQGGGHKNAAGGSSKLKLAETVAKFTSLFEQNVNSPS